MSAVLLTNTFAAQQSAQGQPGQTAPTLGGPGQSQAEAIGTAATPEAVAPAQRGGESRGTGPSTGYAGTGGGAGGTASQQPAWAKRSPDATPDSVVAARAAALKAEQVDQMARDATLALMEARRDQPMIARAEVIDTAQQTRDMANEMPDPLPTAPVLRKS